MGIVNDLSEVMLPFKYITTHPCPWSMRDAQAIGVESKVLRHNQADHGNTEFLFIHLDAGIAQIHACLGCFLHDKVIHLLVLTAVSHHALDPIAAMLKKSHHSAT
eukprot:scpid111927/ scgid8618/ 